MRVDNMTTRLVAFRVYLIVRTIQTLDLAFNEPLSRAFALREDGGDAALFASALMAALTLLVAVDLLLELYGRAMAERLSDWMDRRPRLSRWIRTAGDWPFRVLSVAYRFLAKRRHLFWMLMALGYAVQTMVAAYYGFVPRLALLYIVDAAACFAVAWLDNSYRFQAKTQELRESGYGGL